MCDCDQLPLNKSFYTQNNQSETPWMAGSGGDICLRDAQGGILLTKPLMKDNVDQDNMYLDLFFCEKSFFKQVFTIT